MMAEIIELTASDVDCPSDEIRQSDVGEETLHWGILFMK